jgi:hypothetical protein
MTPSGYVRMSSVPASDWPPMEVIPHFSRQKFILHIMQRDQRFLKLTGFAFLVQSMSYAILHSM